MDSALENSEVRKQLQQLGDFISKVLSEQVKLQSSNWVVDQSTFRSPVYVSADAARPNKKQSYSLLVRAGNVCFLYWNDDAISLSAGNLPESSLEPEGGQVADVG